MSKLEEREKRRRASVVTPIAGIDPEASSARRGRPKEHRELKKRVGLSVFPSLYDDIQKIAYVQRRTVSELLSTMMEEYRSSHTAELEEYKTLDCNSSGTNSN